MIEKIVKEIERLSGNYSGYEIFSDWVKLCAISISNSTDLIHNDVWKRREREYMEIAGKHGASKMMAFSHMMEMLTVALEENMEDILGKIYMAAGLGSKQTGQFFTPFHISKLAAELGVADTDEKIVMNEPSTGGGGMVIAVAAVLKERGINYQNRLEVTASDLDWKGVYMSYVQFSLLGISATVIQGDSLSTEKKSQEQIFYTPKKKGVIS